MKNKILENNKYVEYKDFSKLTMQVNNNTNEIKEKQQKKM